MQPIIRSNNSWTNKQSCQLSCQLRPSSRRRSTLLRTHGRTHGRTHAAARQPAPPRWGSGKCSASKPPQPRPHESRPPVCFISVKTNRHHTAALSGRDSDGVLGSLLKHASSRAVLRCKPSLLIWWAIPPIDHRGRSDRRTAGHTRTKGKSRDYSQLSVCPVVSVSPVPILARSVSKMNA